jgi:GT2 family glycosyltransferase
VDKKAVPAGRQVDLSVIVLNYNTKELLRNCLESIEKARRNNFLFETIIVDNASIDGSPQMVKEQFPRVKLIKNSENYGFAKGNNVGIRQSCGRYLLLLNSDTEVACETLAAMINFMDKTKEAGLATCRVELTDGDLDPACHRGFPTPWASLTYMLGLERLFPRSRIFAQYHQTFKDLEMPHQIDATTGAFFLLRREILKQVGYLDEDYFMYGEDLDWAYRIKKAGWQVWYNPKVKIIHHKKQSGRAKNLEGEEAERVRGIRKKSTNYFYETMKIFYRKHYDKQYPQALTALVMFGIEIKRRLTLDRI